MTAPKKLSDLINTDIMQYNSELPEFEVSTSMEYLITRGIGAVQTSISNLIDNDVRPYLLTKVLINLIPDPKWRLETTKIFNDTCKKYYIDNISSREIIIACTDVLGRVTDWCTQLKGSNMHNVAIGGL